MKLDISPQEARLFLDSLIRNRNELKKELAQTRETLQQVEEQIEKLSGQINSSPAKSPHRKRRRRGQNLEDVIDLLSRNPQGLMISDIASRLEINVNSIRSVLKKDAEKGESSTFSLGAGDAYLLRKSSE